MYRRSGTFIQVGKQSSRALKVSKGVRQGDPLSPLLFNLVVDLGLAEIPVTVGYSLGDTRVNAIAFADDVILVAETAAGLQSALTAFAAKLSETGMMLNPMKCANKVKVTDKSFTVRGTVLPRLAVTSLWRYLGLEFVGSKDADFDGLKFTVAIDKISSAPMRAQMRIALLRDFLLPRFTHGLTFGKITASKLRVLDHHIRKSVRKWLDLPTSCPNAYVHAPTSAGGLGVPSLLIFVPKIKLSRLVRLETSAVPAVREAFRLYGAETSAAPRRAVDKHLLLPSQAEQLYASVDGGDLRLAGKCRGSTDFMRKPWGIPSAEFRKFCKLRINALPTKKRMNRGRQGDTRCRACAAPAETLAHVVQSCPRTQESRLLRHDHIVHRLRGALKDKSWEVQTEKLYKLPEGNLKPDLVAFKSGAVGGTKCVILDVQVVSARGVENWHRTKVQKYDQRADLKTMIRSQNQAINVQTVAATLTWRGIWEPNSYQSLKSIGLSDRLLSGIATSVLRGSLFGFFSFNTRNDMFRRVGVG
jgi:hypothetical protein